MVWGGFLSKSDCFLKISVLYSSFRYQVILHLELKTEIKKKKNSNQRLEFS